jgi:hypothetical protein
VHRGTTLDDAAEERRIDGMNLEKMRVLFKIKLPFFIEFVFDILLNRKKKR